MKAAPLPAPGVGDAVAPATPASRPAPRWTVHVDEVPPETTVWEWIVRRTDVAEAMRDVVPRDAAARAPVIDVPHPFDLATLRHAWQGCADAIGEQRGFAASDARRTAYVGFSLTWNPDHIDRLEPYFSTFGTPRNKAGEYFALRDAGAQPLRRDSYWDAHGFTAIHPTVARHFRPLLEQLSLTLVRSRAATLVHTQPQITSPEFNWHLDESPFCNLRVNIPLWTAPEYRMEIDSQHRQPGFGRAASEGPPVRWRGHLQAGRAYSWDTALAHRVYAEGTPARDRIHLVLGFSPWFDHDAGTRTWSSNAFYGTLHPLDIAARGSMFRARPPASRPGPTSA